MEQGANRSSGRWLAVAALAFVALTAVGVAQLRAGGLGGDDAKEPAIGAKQEAAKAAVAAKQAARKAAYATRLATFKKEFASCKTSLAAAIVTAEAATQGRAHAADVEFGRDQKLHLVVGVLAGEKLIEVIVDPATGKVVRTLDDEADEADEDEEGDEEGDDGDDDDEDEDDDEDSEDDEDEDD